MPIGTAVLDFGSTPAQEASVAVTGQGAILSTSQIGASIRRNATSDNGVAEHEEGAALCPLVCGSIVVGTGFTIYAHPLAMLGRGTFNVDWAWK